MTSLIKILTVLIVATLVLMVNVGAAKIFGLKVDFSAAGLHSNYARIDALKQSKERVNIVLLGSSMMGRLLPEYFPNDEGVLNLGMDGGGVNSSIELFLQSGVKADCVIVELNGLGYEVVAQGASMINYAKSKDSVVRATIPALSYQYRPTDQVYTLLKRWKDQKSRGEKIEGRLKNNDLPLIQKQKEYLLSLVNQLNQQAEKIVFVEIPSKAVPNKYLSECLSLNNKLEVIKMANFPVKDLYLTDQIHLNLPSAEKVAQTISEML